MSSYARVKLHFVIPPSCLSANDVNDEMKIAFQECMTRDLSPKWISERKCFNFFYTNLMYKNYVFIMQEFSGPLFHLLRSTKTVHVLGPVCLRTCLAESTNIQEYNSPVFTTAMRNLIITGSVTHQKKTEIKEKVGFMGGVYKYNLMETTTHLVSNSVLTKKYEKATEKGMIVMTEDWIEAVWRASLKGNVKATDPEFDKYKCKIFQNLEITGSNLDRAEKEKIKKLVNENGGTFTPVFYKKITSLLVISSPHGDKYEYAKSWKIPCVCPSWITESCLKGYAVPIINHLVSTKMTCSTLTSTDLTRCWEIFCIEHGIRPDGTLATDDCDRFFYESDACKYVTRALMVDWEPSAIASNKSSRKISPYEVPTTNKTGENSGKSSGGNSYCPRDTPSWQKKITYFFPKEIDNSPKPKNECNTGACSSSSNVPLFDNTPKPTPSSGTIKEIKCELIMIQNNDVPILNITDKADEPHSPQSISSVTSTDSVILLHSTDSAVAPDSSDSVTLNPSNTSKLADDVESEPTSSEIVDNGDDLIENTGLIDCQSTKSEIDGNANKSGSSE